MSAPAELALGGSPSRREMMLWGAAGLVVLLAHSAFALAFNKATLFSPPPEAAEQAMEIELTPLPVTLPEIVGAESFLDPVPTERIEPMEDEPAVEEAVPEEIQPVDPELAMAEPSEPETLTPVEQPEPVETVEAEPVPDTLQPEPDPVEPETIQPDVVEPEIVEQPIPDTIMPEVALAIPTPKPVIEPVEEEQPRPKEAKPKEKPKERPAERKPAQPKKTVEKPAKVAKTKPPSSASSRAAKASKAPQVLSDRYKNSVWAAISRRLHRSRIERATLTVNFVVNSSGAIVSASIGRSSGDGSIDAAVLRAVRSARLPAPPAGTGRSTHNFTVPVTFN